MHFEKLLKSLISAPSVYKCSLDVNLLTFELHPTVGKQLLNTDRLCARFYRDIEYAVKVFVTLNLNTTFDSVIVLQVHYAKLVWHIFDSAQVL